MITSEQCESLIEQCQLAGTNPEVSLPLAAAAMRVCRALITLKLQITFYERVAAAEATAL
jgi:hypothetical protein